MSRTRSRRPRPTATLPLLDIPFRPPRHPRPPYEWLDPEGIERLHNASLDILERVGVEFLDDEALDIWQRAGACLLYTSPSPRDRTRSRMPSSA